MFCCLLEDGRWSFDEGTVHVGVVVCGLGSGYGVWGFVGCVGRGYVVSWLLVFLGYRKNFLWFLAWAAEVRTGWEFANLGSIGVYVG